MPVVVVGTFMDAQQYLLEAFYPNCQSPSFIWKSNLGQTESTTDRAPFVARWEGGFRLSGTGRTGEGTEEGPSPQHCRRDEDLLEEREGLQNVKKANGISYFLLTVTQQPLLSLSFYLPLQYKP